MKKLILVNAIAIFTLASAQGAHAQVAAPAAKGNNEIPKVEKPAQTLLHGAWRISVDDSGNMFVFDDKNNVIRMVNVGTIFTSITENFLWCYNTNDKSAKMKLPMGLAIDREGNLTIDDKGSFANVENIVTVLPHEKTSWNDPDLPATAEIHTEIVAHETPVLHLTQEEVKIFLSLCMKSSEAVRMY